MNSQILVLNKFWTPVKIINFKLGISLLFKCNKDNSPKALAINLKNYQAYQWSQWITLIPNIEDQTIKTPNKILIRPQIIVLTTYNGTANHKMMFNRKNLFNRDKFTCSYCGNKKSAKELTIDHIIPVSNGGATNWLNCTSACDRCNRKKGNRLLEKTNFKLLKQPFEPTWNMFIAEYIEKLNINFLK